MSKATDFLDNHQSSTPSKWKKNAQWRRENERWLGYARIITVKVLKAMDDQSVTQTALAEKMGCTRQYLSDIDSQTGKGGRK